jgi:hypothetical protein
MLSTILLILLIVLLVGAFSGRRRWGHGPGGVVGLVLISCSCCCWFSIIIDGFALPPQRRQGA